MHDLVALFSLEVGFLTETGSFPLVVMLGDERRRDFLSLFLIHGSFTLVVLPRLLQG